MITKERPLTFESTILYLICGIDNFICQQNRDSKSFVTLLLIIYLFAYTWSFLHAYIFDVPMADMEDFYLFIVNISAVILRKHMLK